MTKLKTNAMRILDANKVSYEVMTYDSEDGKIDGISVAEKIGQATKHVYKTLVAQSSNRNIYVFIVPVEAELDLKKAAKAMGEKKVDLVPVKDIQKLTGYIRGGCSPIGMKKQYPTILDYSATLLEYIIVSGGKIGVQLKLSVEALQQTVGVKVEEIKKNH